MLTPEESSNGNINIRKKIDFRSNNHTRDIEVYFMKIRDLIHQDHVAILNIYVPINKVLKYI